MSQLNFSSNSTRLTSEFNNSINANDTHILNLNQSTLNINSTSSFNVSAPSETTDVNDSDVDWHIPGDEVTKATYYNVILWTPFVSIPLLIVFFRLIKYVYKFYKAKSKGQDLVAVTGIDPFLELSLTLTNNQQKLAQIKRIKREQEHIRKWKERTSAEKKHELITNTVDHERTAVDFLRDLQAKTSRTWTKKISPEAMRRIFSATRFGRMWMIFQVTCTVIAIINYIILTYAIDRQDRKFVKRLDVGLAFIFLLDYIISFYTAEDRLRFYFNPSSLIDLLSIIPPFVYVFIPETSKYVWFLGLLRILRASRVLRTYRLISFQENEETRELTILALSFVNFLFLAASVINAFESLQGTRKDPPTLTTWHDSLYYIMVTFSTIGFGDLTPSTIPSRVIVMCLIVLVIIFVPLQTGKLAELYNSTNAYQRAKFTPSPVSAHVIVTGEITQSSIIDFCREYFSNDPTGHIVILSNETPKLEVKKLLRHPYYKHRVHYLFGSPLVLSDLRRASAEQATGVFLLNTDNHGATVHDMGEEELQVTRGADAQLLMQSLVIKTTNPGLPVFVQVQDIRSQDLSKNCGADRTLCIDDTKMALIAKNCVVPGLLTFVMNLVHTYQSTDLEAEESWKKEYQDGAANQIFSFKFPPGFVSKTFHDSSLALFNAFNVTLLGVFRGLGRLSMNPGRNYIIQQDDIALCIGSSGDDMILRICIQFADPQGVVNEIPNILTFSGPSSATFDATSSQNVPRNKTTNVENKILKSVDMNENMANLIQANTSSSVSGCFANEPVENTQITNAVTSSVNPLGRDYVNEEHIILCGTMTARGIRQFIRTLRNNNKTKIHIPITILLESLPDVDNGIWKDIIDFPKVNLVKGTPLKKSTLVQIGIERCKIIVIFSSSEKGRSDDSDLPDANSIFIVQMIKEEWPRTKFTVELVNGTNTKFLSMREQLSDMSNIRMETIISNYGLSIADRVALYKQARSVEIDQFGIFSRIKRFIAPKVKTSQSGYSPAGTSPISAKSDRKYESLSGEDNLDGKGQSEVPFTSAFISKLEQEAELSESGLSAFPTYHFDRHFAAGMVSTSSFIHSLICQSYFRPYILDLVKSLILRVELIPLDPIYRGKKYGEVYFHLLSENVITVGVYRKGKKWRKDAILIQKGTTEDIVTILQGSNTEFSQNSSTSTNPVSKFPYVYTNCKAIDTVYADDCLFVVRLEDSPSHYS